MFQPLKYYIVMLDMRIKQDVHMTKALFLCTGRWSCANIHGRVGGLCIGKYLLMHRSGWEAQMKRLCDLVTEAVQIMLIAEHSFRCTQFIPFIVLI